MKQTSSHKLQFLSYGKRLFSAKPNFYLEIDLKMKDKKKIKASKKQYAETSLLFINVKYFRQTFSPFWGKRCTTVKKLLVLNSIKEHHNYKRMSSYTAV